MKDHISYPMLQSLFCLCPSRCDSVCLHYSYQLLTIAHATLSLSWAPSLDFQCQRLPISAHWFSLPLPPTIHEKALQKPLQDLKQAYQLTLKRYRLTHHTGMMNNIRASFPIASLAGLYALRAGWQLSLQAHATCLMPHSTGEHRNLAR